MPDVTPEKTMGENGQKLVQDFEKYRQYMYSNDGGGHCTIGWGHLVHRGQCDGRENEKVFLKDGVDRIKADEMLNDDMKAATKVVRNAMAAHSCTPTQNQFDAMVSFCYNAGRGSFLKMLSGAKAQDGTIDLAKIPDRMKLYNKANKKISKGLTNRREAEVKLYNTPDEDPYSPVEPAKSAPKAPVVPPKIAPMAMDMMS